MIKAELVEAEGETSIYFSSSNNSGEDVDTLDKILALVVGNFPKRGTFPLGLQNNTLKIDVNTKQ